jgi:YfiH family protein
MFTLDPAGFYTSTAIQDANGFSTRGMGDGTDIGILTAFSKNILHTDKLTTLKQVHSGTVAFVDAATKELVTRVEATDGVVTDDPKRALFLKTADCLPALFVDTTAHLCGAAHLGYKGVLAGLTEAMVEEFITHGSEPRDITVAIGPTIGNCCYDIGPDRALQFRTRYPQYESVMFRRENDKTFLNLSRLVHDILLGVGVPDKNIDVFDMCTKCHVDEFYSYRGEGKKLTGEIFSFVMMR